MIKFESTKVLKIAIVLIALPVLAMSVFIIPQVFIEFGKNQTALDYLVYCIFLAVYASSIPFFMALYQGFKLLDVIDRGKAFTKYSIRALRKIKKYALIIFGVWLVSMPAWYRMAENEDAPGVIVIGLFVVFMSFVVATFAGLCQKLFRAAIDIKSENDLTV